MERSARGVTPPILTLLRYADDHRTALACDLRQTFGVSIDDLGEGVSWGEAWELVQGLVQSPGTRMHAELAGWQWPMTRLEQVLFTLTDVQGSAQVKAWKAIERPWDERRKRLGNTASLTQEQVLERLRALGPKV